MVENMRFHIHVWKYLGEKDIYSSDPIRSPYRYPVRVDVRQCYLCKTEEGGHKGYRFPNWRPIFERDYIPYNSYRDDSDEWIYEFTFFAMMFFVAIGVLISYDRTKSSKRRLPRVHEDAP